MKKNIRWGILGCGKIAHKFASDLRLVKDATLAAVASRDPQKSAEFVRLYNAEHSFQSYEEMAKSDVVDVIYVATPHSLHHDHTLLCLKNKKAVLCEKAFALNSDQAQEMVNVARQNNAFLMEALWTKFLPQFQKISQLVSSGVIGDIRWIQADFGLKLPEPAPQRLLDPALGGGALLEVGVYPVFLALSLLGEPQEISGTMVPSETGVDEQFATTFTFPSGAVAVLSGSFTAETPVEAVIAGTKGSIRWRNRFHNFSSEIELKIGKDPSQKIDLPREEGFGYQFEARHVVECLQHGLLESSIRPTAHTLLLMQTLDKIRRFCLSKHRAWSVALLAALQDNLLYIS